LRCPLTSRICPPRKGVLQFCFIGMPFQVEYNNVLETIKQVLSESNFKSWVATEQLCQGHILCKICSAIRDSTLTIFEITDQNPNVMIELGYSLALGKNPVLISQKSTKRVPSNIRGFEIIKYKNLKELKKQLENCLIQRQRQIEKRLFFKPNSRVQSCIF
jgi:hypothetical protein